MIAKESFKNRLNKAMQIRNIKPVELVEKTKISKANISCYMSGKYEAKADGLKLLADALNVDPVWLMGYDVPMERVPNELRGVIQLSELYKDTVPLLRYS